MKDISVILSGNRWCPAGLGGARVGLCEVFNRGHEDCVKVNYRKGEGVG